MSIFTIPLGIDSLEIISQAVNIQAIFFRAVAVIALGAPPALLLTLLIKAPRRRLRLTCRCGC